MEEMFNLMKLPEYTPLFKSKRIAILGGGAVGSYLAEILCKMGVGYLQIYDFDTFTLENAAKHSGIVRTPEDAGRNKAHAVAQRAQVLMVHGGKAIGIDTDVRKLGPMAFAGFDAILLALDNYAAKELVNQLFLQIPPAQRPGAVGMAGTSGESAVSVLLDGKKFCLRCLFDESWLENAERRTSCSGPQYMHIDGEDSIVRTSGLASIIAAANLAEKVRGWTLGCDKAMNTRTTYTAYPNLALEDTEPDPRNDCPDCKRIKPPENIRLLSGSVLDLTLREALHQISDILKTNKYDLLAHLLVFGEIGYGGFICDDYCHHCGKPVSVYAHEGRVHFNEVLCDDCKANDRFAYFDAQRPAGEALRCFSPQTTDRRLLDMTLYELGYPVGAFLNVVCKEPENEKRRFYFSCLSDPSILQKTDKL